MNRRHLADFLRARRARVQPADVGVPAGRRRRTPGLRREEVAQLACISVDYYARLEQARGPQPSRQVLVALARALRLTDSEREHLYQLAGLRVDIPPGPPRDVPAGILHLIDRLDDTPAFVIDHLKHDRTSSHLAALGSTATESDGRAGNGTHDLRQIRMGFSERGATRGEQDELLPAVVHSA